jgi:F-type H+-transporting ATPase subunit a
MKFVPFLLTAFFFIWINNLLGLIPWIPGGANVTGNISVTLVLAAFTLIVTNLNGNKEYWGHIFWMPGAPVLVKIMLAPIELVGVLTKPFALMVRLFANITAGHIIVLSLISLIFIFKNAGMSAVSVPFTLFISVLELLVAFLQAYVFTMLSALFIGTAVAEHDHH